MPSLVTDEAVEAAKEKVDDAITDNNNNLSPKKKPSPKLASSSSSRRRRQDYSSPLFRDEVVQQEMRYFDEVLRGVGGCGYNLPAYKPSFGVGVEGSNLNNKSQKQRQINSPKRSSSSPAPTSHQHHRPAKQSNNRHVRSRNIRQQTNRKLLLRARISSRRVMRKLSGIGKTCSKKWDKVANAIHHRILEAMASMNALLEDNGVSTATQQRRSFGAVVVRSQHQRERSTSNNDNRGRTDHGDSSNNGTGTLTGIPKVPPQMFRGTTTWFKNRTERISSMAIAKAKDSIRNRKVFIV